MDRLRVPATFAGQLDTAFSLDLRRAVAMRNRLTARLTMEGAPPREAKTDFIARPAPGAFDDYQIVMWQQQNPVQWAALKRIGVTAGISQRPDCTSLLENGILRASASSIAIA